MNRLRKSAIVVMLTALGVAAGYLFAAIPNVELVLPTIFIAGFLTGVYGGFLTGFLTFAIYGFFNPFGPSPLPFLLIQCLAGGIVGIGGGVLFWYKKENVILFAFSGFIITLTYDLITNLAGFILFPTGKTFIAYLVAGIPFSLVHTLSNTLIFGAVVYPLTRTLKRRFLC